MQKEFDIPFKGLKQGEHSYKYHITKKFFDSFTLIDFIDANINATLSLQKTATLLKLYFNIKGKVLVNCDVSGEEYWQNIEGNLEIIVKFGNKFNDDDEVILILPHSAYNINIAKYIYEITIFSIPIKRVHPDIVEEQIRFKDLNIARGSKKETLKKKEIDPRWEKLKKLL